jgi:nucleotide-binding universal stress UspA family protein
MEYLDRQAYDVRIHGLTVETMAGTGDRVEAIIQAAHDTHSGLIAMSTHGRRGLGRIALGSTADGVIRQAEVPVLAICPVAGAEHA